MTNSRRRRTAALLTGLVFLPWARHAAAGPCDDVTSLRRQRAELKAQADALERARPFVEKFDQVKRAIDALHETLRKTGGDVEKTRERIDDLLGLARQHNTELRQVRRWARGVYTNPAWEPGAPDSGRKPITLPGALQRVQAVIEQIEKDAERFKSVLDVLERAIQAREGRPSEQLEALARYLEDLAGLLGKAVGGAPIARLMLETMKYFTTAIRRIAGSVRLIEVEYSRRDEILRELGPEFDNVRYHWPLETPWGRLARHKREMVQEIARLDQRLRACGVDPDADPRPDPQPDDGTEFQRARQVAQRHCAAAAGVRSRGELLDRRDEALRAIQRFYPRQEPFPAGYGSELSADEEIDWARRRHQRWLAEKLEPARNEVARLERSVAGIERRFEQYRRREIRLTSADAGQLNIDRQENTRRLGLLRARLAEGEQSAKRRQQALDDIGSNQMRMKRFDDCVRGRIEDLAGRLNWDMAVLRRTHPDLYAR